MSVQFPDRTNSSITGLREEGKGRRRILPRKFSSSEKKERNKPYRGEKGEQGLHFFLSVARLQGKGALVIFSGIRETMGPVRLTIRAKTERKGELPPCQYPSHPNGAVGENGSLHC